MWLPRSAAGSGHEPGIRETLYYSIVAVIRIRQYESTSVEIAKSQQRENPPHKSPKVQAIMQREADQQRVGELRSAVIQKVMAQLPIVRRAQPTMSS